MKALAKVLDVHFLTLTRLLALEMGKPCLINDQDCDVDLPCAIIDERYISDSGCIPDSQQTTPLLATIHVVRSIGQLTRTLRCSTIGPATLETFERHFDACLTTFPAPYHPRSDQPLDPRSLAPIIYLQNARFTLHRHNISPICPADARSSALDCCLTTALDTAHLLARCLHHTFPAGPGKDVQAVFASAATTMLCTHIWRCTLLLLFRQEYAAALMCVRASAVIGDCRTVNAACGRYLAFFIRCLLDSGRHSDPSIDPARDEELIAYVSGDMQGSADASWVWQGSETGSQLGVLSPQLGGSSMSPPEIGSEPVKWEGWDWVERTVQYLLSEQQHQPSSLQLQPPSQDRLEVQEPTRTKESTYLSPDAATTRGSGSDSARRSSNSRMTIASII